MLAGDEVLRDLDVLQELDAEFQLLDLAELGEVAAEDQEVGGRRHLLHVLRRAHHLVDEARVERSRIEMRVRNPGELEGRFGCVSDVEGVEQRPPGEGLADGGGAEHQGLVDEGAPGDLDRVVGTNAWLLQHRMDLTPLAFKFVGHPAPSSHGRIKAGSSRGGRGKPTASIVSCWIVRNTAPALISS